MSRILLILLLISFGRQLTYAQHFEPGYLVLQRGDTLRGEVENAFWEDPPVGIRFRAAPTAELSDYPSNQLHSVYLASGRLLRSELLPIDRFAETRLAYLSTTVQHKQRPETVMADVLVTGPASLLGIVLNETRHYFVQRPGQPYLELTARNYLVLQNGTDRIADANDFKSQLRLYFGDCEAVTSLLDNVPFTSEGLKRVVQAYNRQCSSTRQAGQEIMALAVEQRSRVAVRVGALAGLRYNSFRFKGQGPTGAVLDGLDIDGQAHVQGGVYADLLSAGRRLALHTSLLVSRFGNSQPMAFAATANTWAGEFQWNGTQVAAQLGLRGFFPLGPQLRLLVGGGYEINDFLDSNAAFVYNNQPEEFYYSIHGSVLPYLEAGLSRNRMAVTLNGRLYEEGYFSHSYYTPSTISDVGYTYQPWSLSLAFSYRLNADSDATSPANP